MADDDIHQPDCCPEARELPRGEVRRRQACALFKALSDPTRMEIFALVAARPEPLCVCDIVSRFELTQPTISHHLRILRRAGLVTATRRGTWAYYAVSDAGVDEARRLLDAVLPRPTTAAT